MITARNSERLLTFTAPLTVYRSTSLLKNTSPPSLPYRPALRKSPIASVVTSDVATSTESQMSSSSAFREKYGPWALVTGASSGIGAEFASQLAARYRLSLVLVARREDRLHKLADTLRDTCQVETKVIRADLTTTDGIQSVIQQCQSLEIGLLVNNAGEEFHGSFFRASAEELRHMISLNVTAVTELAHAFGRPMVERGRGGILFVSSISASGMPWLATYASTKSFVTCLALTLREELLRSGVECMSLEPGLVVSEITVPEGKPKDGAYNNSLMPTDYCVSEALRVFGTKAVFTPGLMNRILKNFLLMLPRPTALWLLSEYLIRVTDPKVLKY